MRITRPYRYFAYKIYKKADTYIVPTLSYDISSNLPIEELVPKHFNLSKSEYFGPALEKELISNEAHQPDNSHALYKLIVDIEPNFEALLKFIHLKQAENIIYLNIKSEHYLYLSKLIEKENELHNLVMAIENQKLSEEEIIQLYEEISLPINIGLASDNIKNFKETDTETSIRRYLKEMFRFYNNVKLIELEFADLQTVMNKTESDKKTADFNTIIDFTLMAEFKGYLDISLNDMHYDHTKKEFDNLKTMLDDIDRKLIERGFVFGIVENKTNLLELLNNMKPDDDHLAFSSVNF